jgi:serine/threonine-protein kinase
MPPRLGRYEVRAKIAEGGMATVFVGRAPLANGGEQVVALKMIRDEFSLNRDFVNMFRDEAKIASGLNHPNIVKLYELGVEGPRIFLAMELLFGQSLWQVWDACREKHVRLRYDIVAWIGARVAEGLHYAHEMRDAAGHPLQIVHRDVNATNVFITYDGLVKIIDFGLAKATNRVSKTAAGVIKGKVAYMSPEQAIGAEVDRRTDLFALATTLWELSVDRRLFKHTDDIETLKRVHAAEVPDPRALVEGYPPMLWGVLKRALARTPDARYATGAEMAHDLDAIARSEGRQVSPATLAEVMRELFAADQERQRKWIADASAVDRAAPKETLKPPTVFYGPNDGLDVPLPPAPRVPSEASDVGPATFSPAARPPLALPVGWPLPSALPAPPPIARIPPPPPTPRMHVASSAPPPTRQSRAPSPESVVRLPKNRAGVVMLVALVAVLALVGVAIAALKWLR